MATKTTVFQSVSPNLQVIIRPGRPEERAYDNRVLSPKVDPVEAFFNNNRFETSDPEIIKGLREAPDFQQPRGFWEEGKAPDEPKPTRTDQSKVIAQAIAKADVAKLQEIRDEEVATHNRPDVVAQAEEGISAITVPEEEELGAVKREDLPAEREDTVPKVDAPDTPQGRVEPEIAHERIEKSEDVARARAEVVGDDAKVDKKIEAEQEAAGSQTHDDSEKLAGKVAKAGVEQPKKKAPAKSKKK